MTLEGRLIPGLQLGRLTMLQQQLRVGGTAFTLLMPADKDFVYDLYSYGGRRAGEGAGVHGRVCGASTAPRRGRQDEGRPGGPPSY